MAASRNRSREEREFLANYDPGDFDRPSLAVDVVVLTVQEAALRVLLVQRTEYPDKGRWSLPGGFVGIEESIDDAAARLLSAKAGLEGVFLEQLYTFGAPDRDPRMRIITVAHYALVDAARLAGKELAAIDVPWEGEAGGPVQLLDSKGARLALAFDHAEIIGAAVKRIRGKLDYTPIGFELLPNTFTLRELQDVHETILGHALNKDSFRRRMLASGVLVPTGKIEANVEHRPAERYRLKR